MIGMMKSKVPENGKSKVSHPTSTSLKKKSQHQAKVAIGMTGPIPKRRSQMQLKAKSDTQPLGDAVQVSRKNAGYSKKVSIPSKKFRSSQPIPAKANHFNLHRGSSSLHKGTTSNDFEEDDEDYEMEDDGEYDSTDQDCTEEEAEDASEIEPNTEFVYQ
ncbi:unnamed protein product [Linum trigynum]|uniref:Uncharacterized protein n=1 Tax=Linum trigynum TaxID=586398 RepID=A0AAV2G575_9ROSI